MNSNNGNPSSTSVDPRVACLAPLCDGDVDEPFACPVNLDEERDAKVSARPRIATKVAVEPRDDASRMQAPKPPSSLPSRPSLGETSSPATLPLSTASDTTTEATMKLTRKLAPRPPQSVPFQPSSVVLDSRSSCTAPEEQEKELDFPFALDRHPAQSIVAQMPNPSVHITSFSAPLQAWNNQSGHQASILQNGVNRWNLDYFAEFARRKKCSIFTPRTKPASRPQIVNTPLGLAVLLNHSGSRQSVNSRHTAPPSPANTIQHRPATAMEHGATNAAGANQQVHLNTVASMFSQESNDQARKFQRWSPEEDMRLRIGVEKEGGPPFNWKRIASKYFSNTRTSLQCKSRWTKSLKPGIVRGPFTPEEDAIILKFKQEGLKWSQITEYLSGRLTEQIADRYNNFLDPTLKKGPWTPEEDRILFQEQRRLGNRWTQISHLIPGRSENSVKNRWHNLKVTRQRKMRQNALELQRQDSNPALSQAQARRKMRQDAMQLQLRKEMGTDTSDMQRKRLLEMRIRLLQSKMASKASVPNPDSNRVETVPEQNRLEDRIQLLQLGAGQTATTGANCAPKEVIEILDDDDDDNDGDDE